ncbi:DUF3486 family protein [Pyruvatibacter sp.]|uniref:DUF3486 family protein n=1 Tax=Pyruvatibacter sp. TaxID=1981328 RepID=UPI0032EC31F9
MSERRKRGRLSKIEMLPDDCQEDVVWASKELTERRRTAEEIRLEFNARIEAKGQEPISSSAFNRHSVAFAKYSQNMAQAREIASIMAERMDDQPDGDVGLLLVETIKTLVYDVVVDATLADDSAGIKMLKEAAVAVQKLEQARKTNVETRVKIADRFVTDAADAAEAAAIRSGLSGPAAADIRKQVLGVREPAK